MLTKIFLSLTNSARFRRLAWKPVYELLAKKFKVKNWSFMNYGYAPSVTEPALQLHTADEKNRYSIQLYHYLATKVVINNTDVLEVGSGRGGGAWYIKHYLQPNTVTGLDIALNAVKMARNNYKSNGLFFVQGSAEKLPFANESFDVVINVESSHTYGSVPLFLAEVKRVLRKGGYLLITEIRVAATVTKWQQQLAASGLQLISAENISQQVARAIELEEPVKQQRIQTYIPKWLQQLFKEFAGVVGSQAHTQLSNGQLVYYRFVLQKNLNT